MRNIIFIGTLVLSGCAHMTIPNLNGSCPYDYPIKGNASSQIYHVPASPYYEKTLAEFCFDSAEAARKNGFIPPKR